MAQNIFQPFLKPILNKLSPKSQRISRRDLILGMGFAGGAAALSTLLVQNLTTDSTQESVPFFGEHQSGILNPAPAAALIATFDVLAKNKDDLIRLFKILTDRLSFATIGGDVPALDPKLPPANSGLLNPSKIFPDNLTATISVGASLFDDRFGLGALRPKHLVAMPKFSNDALDVDLSHGDLLIQFCANTAETNIHALREVIKNLPDLISLRWKMEGFLPAHNVNSHSFLKSNLISKKETVRNMLGFKDGTANLNPQDHGLMNRIVWVQARSGEPDWATGGTYQVVRIIRNKVEHWDRTPLQEQEQIIGRKKDSGAPLGMKNENDIPNYSRDRKGEIIPLDAHIRLANPRISDLGKILRRGFNYSRGYSKSGQLDMGLLFVCFQSNLQKGFITVQERLSGEPLEEYIQPIGGGYFFALPGVANKNNYLGQSLLEA